MYVICVYDVEERKCNKVMKILWKYLFHVQNSVFEGTLTPKQFNSLEKEIETIVSNKDSVIFYFLYNEKQIYKKNIGKQIKISNILID